MRSPSIKLVLIFFCLFPLVSHADRGDLWIKNLYHEHPLVRKNAVFYLGRMKEEKAVPHLVKLLQDPISQDLEITIVMAFAKIGDLSILPFLRKRYVKINQKNDVLKKAYIQAIAKLEKIYEYQSDKKEQ
jgi:HEAT repeat protein